MFTVSERPERGGALRRCLEKDVAIVRSILPCVRAVFVPACMSKKMLSMSQYVHLKSNGEAGSTERTYTQVSQLVTPAFCLHLRSTCVPG